ncbi:MAG TPA: TIGR01440 family protein [Candidatus Cottocaccamicrobium excrementipullorum]|nr:TIGR01440 family protein [Candidatus Cottocaccamicrobium excrementipullorum]
MIEGIKGINPDEVPEEFLEKIGEETRRVAEEFFEGAKMRPGQLLVVGCSSSEIEASRIGTYSSREIGWKVYQILAEECGKRGVYLAAQCCEHLNRALILEQEGAERFGYEPVNVVPQLKAGGSFATAAYESMRQPTAVEEVRADGGIDIGDTLIGMHLKPVAVPMRILTRKIGGANVVCARVRPKYIGGARAVYDEDLQ